MVEEEAMLEQLEQRVLEVIQQTFPIASRPYAELARQIDSTEDEVFHTIQNLRKKGVIRRLGGSFDSRKIGYKSTLGALSVPQNRLDEVVAIVNSYAGVTHNYEREGEYNVWFTIIASSEQERDDTIKEIEDRTGLSVLNMPASHVFKIKVDFDLGDNGE
jgi:DNA-binding Lrp family transcriptional regulator